VESLIPMATDVSTFAFNHGSGVKAPISQRDGWAYTVRSLHNLLVVRASAFVLAASGGLGLAMAGGRLAQAEALLLVDVESGKVISEQNATSPWYPASVTKLMTAYVTFKAMQAKRITPDSLFTVSPNAVAQQPSKMGFKVGTRVTADNALKMMLVHSANDMAIVLAEGVSGSIEKFTAEMNVEANRLGMVQTNYVNPNGLPADQQITSARDLAILTRALIRDFPEYDNYTHIASIRLGKRIYRNTNKLIDAYAGSDGMKTGFICASGYNLVATATRSGKRLIAVVLGATSANSRSVKAAQLFERGFGSDPLSWLRPSQSSVEALEPVSTVPPDMHDEVCSKDAHHPPAEDGDEGSGTGAGGNNGFTLGDWPLTGLRGASVLTPGLAAGIAPVDVYTGPARPPGWAPPAAPPGKKKPVAVAAKPPAGKPPAAKSAPPAAAQPAAAAKPSPSAATAVPKPKPSVAKPQPQTAPATAQ
jgi:D-alanyl-D-alanine carboxypeptidase